METTTAPRHLKIVMKTGQEASLFISAPAVDVRLRKTKGVRICIAPSAATLGAGPVASKTMECTNSWNLFVTVTTK
jgi:hypothetical protein